MRVMATNVAVHGSLVTTLPTQDALLPLPVLSLLTLFPDSITEIHDWKGI